MYNYIVELDNAGVNFQKRDVRLYSGWDWRKAKGQIHMKEVGCT